MNKNINNVNDIIYKRIVERIRSKTIWKRPNEYWYWTGGKLFQINDQIYGPVWNEVLHYSNEIY